MDWTFPPEAEEFRKEIKSFIADHLTKDVIASTHDGTIHNWEFHRKIADRGWLGGAVPEELGGGGKSALEMAVMVEELQLAGAPIDGMGVAIVIASVVLELGNDHLKQTIVPKLLSGDTLVSFGYTEPDSGSDVAAAQTRAIRDGDDWVINGQKMWTTMAHIADYVLLLTRTNTEVPKHKGLTFFIVPLSTSGIEIQPVHTMGTERSNATFYDEVRIGDQWRIGEIDGGWEVMKAALKYERGIAGGQFPSPPLIEATIGHASTATRSDGTKIIDDPIARERLVRALIDVEVCRGFAYNTAFLASEGAMFGVEGSMTKLFASESYKKHSKWFMDLFGTQGLLSLGNPDAPVGGVIDEHFRHAPVTTIYGGTSEISKNLIAEGYLGLPRTR
ncbi:MAG: acyl-CoA dehydrogenase family protein [Acidimicrobiales bacterium]|nr:acyl-CoA dehydrogenase family protein [Acidimicrobiales bacterium]